MGAAGAARCADRSRAHSQHVAVLRTSTVLPPERQNRCPLDLGGHLFWRMEALNRVDGWLLTFDYRYSGVNHQARIWTPPLRALRDRVDTLVGVHFNSCLLNRYEDGNQGMAWHSDDEAELGPETVIASVSFGATRKFAFRHRRTRRKFEMLLHHGQLIVMRGQTQAHWQHALMKSTRVTQPRVNLTFRTIRARG